MDQVTQTPRAVLDAGPRERERFRIVGDPLNSDVLWKDGKRIIDLQPADILHHGHATECQDFITDRVFRAMLREQAALIEPVGIAETYHRNRLLELAGDDQ